MTIISLSVRPTLLTRSLKECGKTLSGIKTLHQELKPDGIIVLSSLK
jgi:hypothetical protein